MFQQLGRVAIEEDTFNTPRNFKSDITKKMEAQPGGGGGGGEGG